MLSTNELTYYGNKERKKLHEFISVKNPLSCQSINLSIKVLPIKYWSFIYFLVNFPGCTQRVEEGYTPGVNLSQFKFVLNCQKHIYLERVQYLLL